MKKILIGIGIAFLFSFTILLTTGRLPYQIIQQIYQGDTIQTYIDGDTARYYTNLSGFDFNKPIKQITDTASQLRTDLAGGGGITPTDGILHWNSGTNKYVPYYSYTGFDSVFYYDGSYPMGTKELKWNGYLQAGRFEIKDASTNDNYISNTAIVASNTTIGSNTTLNGAGYLNINRGTSAGTTPLLTLTDPGTTNKHIFDVNINSVNKIKFDPLVADGSSAVAYMFDTNNLLDTTGAQLLSIKNNGIEKFAIDKDGQVIANGNIVTDKEFIINYYGEPTGEIYGATGSIYVHAVGGNAALTGANAYVAGTSLAGLSVNGVDIALADFKGLHVTKYFVSSLNTAPSSATDTGTTGEIRICSDFIYVCIATNTWVRTALTTW